MLAGLLVEEPSNIADLNSENLAGESNLSKMIEHIFVVVY